jgi:hypothetical protein
MLRCSNAPKLIEIDQVQIPIVQVQVQEAIIQLRVTKETLPTNYNDHARLGVLVQCLDTLDGHGPFGIEFIGILCMALLLAVFQVGASMRFEQSMLGTKGSSAETTVSDDSLCKGLALVRSILLEVAGWLSRRHCDECACCASD